MKKWLFFLTLISYQSFAFQCYFTPMKGSCWKDYTVTIKVLDNGTQKPLMDPVVIEKGKFWKRVKFDCKPSQGLLFEANYKPLIWKTNKQKAYKALRIWFLPNTIKKGIKAWNVPLCFPKQFAQVPTPITATDNCTCTIKKDIPPI